GRRRPAAAPRTGSSPRRAPVRSARPCRPPARAGRRRPRRSTPPPRARPSTAGCGSRGPRSRPGWPPGPCRTSAAPRPAGPSSRPPGPPPVVSSELSSSGVPSHPEDAELRVTQWRVGARGQGQAQDLPGLHRVDHTVVPQPGRRVVGVALLLVLGADRGLEGVLLLGGPLLAAALQLVPLDGGQHRGGLLA